MHIQDTCCIIFKSRPSFSWW